MKYTEYGPKITYVIAWESGKTGKIRRSEKVKAISERVFTDEALADAFFDGLNACMQQFKASGEYVVVRN